MSICLSPARAAASRRNGAKSRGPCSSEGKARSSRNALRHGLCAGRHLVADEDVEAFTALEASILEELAPVGALQKILAGRVVRAAWRLERSERIEAEMFRFRIGGGADLGLALIREGNGSRAFDTLMRYRNAALAELFRCLRVLQAMQNESEAIRTPAPSRDEAHWVLAALRNEPKARGNPGDVGQPGEPGPAQPAPPAWGAPLPPKPQGGLADISLLDGTALVTPRFRAASEQRTRGWPGSL